MQDTSSMMTDSKVAEVKQETPAILSLDDDSPALPFKLISKDKREFPIDRKEAFISSLVKSSLDQDKEAQELPIPSVEARVLEQVVQYMNHHKGVELPVIEKPLRSKLMKDVCKDPWDAEFIDRIGEDRQLLYDVILAANYMDIKSLLHLGCAKVASLIKGQPLEKIKEILSKGLVQPPSSADKKESKSVA